MRKIYSFSSKIPINRISTRRGTNSMKVSASRLAEILKTATCPACGHHVAVSFYEAEPQPLATLAWPSNQAEALSMEKLPLQFVRCVDCGHIYNKDFNYTRVPYSTKPNLMFNKGIQWTDHLSRLRELILLQLPENPVVVEVGCGEGHFLRGLAEKKPGGKYFGFDPNARIETQNGRILGRQEYFVPEKHIRELSPHLVISRHVLEHLMNPLAFIQSLAFSVSWEKIQVALFLEVPCVDRVFETNRSTDFYYEHNSHFTSQSFKRMLERSGARIKFIGKNYGSEVIYAWSVFEYEEHKNRWAGEAVRFQHQNRENGEKFKKGLSELCQRNASIALWGGTGKSAALINSYGMDAEHFPIVVDSDPDKAGSYVPGTGQKIRFRDELKTNPADIVFITTQWRARDIVQEIEREKIPFKKIVLEHNGEIVDYFSGAHPYK